MITTDCKELIRTMETRRKAGKAIVLAHVGTSDTPQGVWLGRVRPHKNGTDVAPRRSTGWKVFSWNKGSVLAVLNYIAGAVERGYLS